MNQRFRARDSSRERVVVWEAAFSIGLALQHSMEFYFIGSETWSIQAIYHSVA